MIVKVVLQKSGMGIEEGTLARWLKAVGDTVQKGEAIAEIETAKALEPLEAPASGWLVQIHVAEGETVPVNATLATIKES